MKPDIDFEEQRTRIDKMIIDMEHNVEQRNHWKAQKWFWSGIFIATIIAMTLNAYILTHQNNNITVEKVEKNET